MPIVAGDACSPVHTVAMNLPRFSIARSSAWLASLLLACSVHAAPPAAGSAVTNTASGSFVDSASGLTVRLTSNTVATVVQALEAVQLSSSQAVSRAPGGSFSASHLLTNSGNMSAAYTIALVATSGSFSPSGLAIVEDLNGNGVADPGEPVLGTGGSVTLAAGASINLLVVGVVPTSAGAGQVAQIRLSATSQSQGATASNIDTINVVTGPAVTVTKAASTTSPVQSGALSYTLSATNSGATPAGGAAVTINGAPASAFVLRDVVPANTTFTGLASASPTAQLLYHRLGEPIASYVTGPPSNTVIDAIALGVPELAPGGSLVATMSVAVNANAAGVLSNTGYADYAYQGANFSAASNPVQLALPALAPTISFFTSNAYATPAQQTALGSPLFVQISAAQCNTYPTTVIMLPVTLTSQLTGDVETFTATETAPNTGIFRILPNVQTANAALHVVASGDGILEVLHDDHIVATLSGCGSASATSTLLVDPSGIVFDSRSNAPVPGASVKLIDVTGSGNGGDPGGPAKVFASDGVTPAPASVTTGSDGSYSFPVVAPSTYRLVIVAPSGYTSPSKLPPGLLPVGRNIDPAGSYGGNFNVTGQSGPVTVDVPLDTGAAGGLFVLKTASKSVAEVGDFVDYSLTLNNNSGTALAAAVINDSLPAGFSYVMGSARLNDARAPDPAGGVGPSLVFGLGTLAIRSQPVLTYRVRIGPGGDGGSGINTAQVVSGSTRSNVATARVEVRGGVLSEKAYLFGKVFADCNADRIQSQDEPGIPGVRIYLDTGTFAITDIQGKYSLYGLTPRTYVAKVDDTSLPKGAVLELLSNRNALDAGSRFADIRNGELHKADFAVSGCSAELLAQIAQRRKALQDKPAEIAQAAAAPILLNPAAVNDARTLPASGLIGTRNPSDDMLVSGRSAVDSAPASASASTLQRSMRVVPAPTSTQGRSAVNAAPALEDALPDLTPQPGFLGLIDGQIIPTDQTRVRVKGPQGARWRLDVNGLAVPDAQVGQKSCLDSSHVCAWEYVGIDLKAGDNLLRLSVMDDFGNVRSESSLHIVAPGALAKIELTVASQAIADAHTPVEVVARLFDARGTPVAARTALTLDSSLGDWQIAEGDSKAVGRQVFVAGGLGRFTLIPPANPGKARLRAESGNVRAETELVFMPELRPMIAAGLVEGILSLRNLDPRSLVPVQGGDAFEREIQSASASFDNGHGTAAARASLFLKGKVLGSDLLTLSYDSDKPGDTALFRDIQPDQYYAIYGDSSIKGFDAQSTGKLYVRLDHGTSYAMYGDFSTQSDNPARVLSQYSRALNGAKAHLEEGRLTADGFASDTQSTQVIDEIPANGTSGPYQISQRNIVVNSQRVDIVTRDRNQPSIVLNDLPLSNLTDYAIEPITGQLLFKSPVTSLDANLNPVYIRVVYEVSSGGPHHWVGGADVRFKVLNALSVSGTYVRDANPLDRQTLLGTNFLWDLGPDTSLIGELAQTRSDMVASGGARRVEFRHTDPLFQARVYAVQTDPNFNNPNSTYTTGVSEYGAKIGYALDAKNRVVVDALKNTTSGTAIASPGSIALVGVPASVGGGASRDGESIGIEHNLPMDAKVTAGLRHVDSNAQATQPLALGAVPNAFMSARVRLDAPLPEVPKANAFVQYEQALDSSDRRAATVGATYQIAPQTKVYATHETSNSLSGDYGLSPGQQAYGTVLGIDTTYMKDGQLFNEYRIGEGIDGRSAQAAIGLRNLWQLAPGLRVSTSVQQVHAISGVVTDKATALTGALDYTTKADWKASAKLEWSTSSAAQTWLATAGAAAKVSPDVTLLTRALYNQQVNSAAGGGVIRLAQAQFGFAYRPVDNDVWNALARIEVKHSKNTTLGAGLDTDEAANILSAHLNYQPASSWVINGRYGIKRTADFANGISSTYTSQIIGARSVWDVSDRWDAGIQYYVELGANGAAGHQQAVGAEVGYLVMKNLWLSVGYNVKGFVDVDLAGEDYTQRAFYLRLRFKFDENLFKPQNNAQALHSGETSRP